MIELIEIQELINSDDDEKIRNLYNVALSDILRVVSNAHPGYPNVMYNKKLPERPFPAELYLKKLEKIVESVAELSKILDPEFIPICDIGDSRHITLSDESVDGIIGHPPYIGAVPYAEYQLINLKWFGYEPRNIDNLLTGGRRQRNDVVERFERDLRLTINELWRVLKKNRVMNLVIGNPIVEGNRIQLDKLILKESTGIGFKEIGVYERKKFNTRANKMSNEFILSFYK